MFSVSWKLLRVLWAIIECITAHEHGSSYFVLLDFHSFSFYFSLLGLSERLFSFSRCMWYILLLLTVPLL